MYNNSVFDESDIRTMCRCCLSINTEVRTMTPDENNFYQQLMKITNWTTNMAVCLYCLHLLKKLKKFVLQCHEASNVFNNYLDKNPKCSIPKVTLAYDLKKSPPQTVDIFDGVEESVFDDEPGCDDDDMPLVMLKKEVECEVKVKRKKKRLKKSSSEKTSNLTDEKQNGGTNVKCKKTPKKELREGFSSRMVQETDEYVVLKLSKEQVLQEMVARSQSEVYQRSLYKCEKCVKGFNFEDVLRTHMEKHSMENGTLQCDICTQYCPSVVSLRGHMKSHTTKYKCKVCGCERQSRQHLLEHHSTHTQSATGYSCRYCHFATTKRTSMQRHVKSHRPSEKHSCHRCGKLFKSLETLRVHTMRHDKPSRLRCEWCGRVFVYPSLLQRHVRAVHERRDYYCVECDRGFRSTENLRLHFKKSKKHRDPSSQPNEWTDGGTKLACLSCDKRFSRKSLLTAHMLTHGPCSDEKKIQEDHQQEVSTLLES